MPVVCGILILAVLSLAGWLVVASLLVPGLLVPGLLVLVTSIGTWFPVCGAVGPVAGTAHRERLGPCDGCHRCAPPLMRWSIDPCDGQWPMGNERGHGLPGRLEMRGLISSLRRAALAIGLAAGTAALSGCMATAGTGFYRGPPLQGPGGYVYGVESPRVVVRPRPRTRHAIPEAYGPQILGPEVHGRWLVLPGPYAHPPARPGIGRPGYRGRDRDWRDRHRPPPGYGIGRPHRAPGWLRGWPSARSPLRDNGRCDDRRYETSNGGRAAPGMDDYDCSRFGGGLKGKYR